jgi:hypothetical protein
MGCFWYKFRHFYAYGVVVTMPRREAERFGLQAFLVGGCWQDRAKGWEKEYFVAAKKIYPKNMTTVSVAGYGHEQDEWFYELKQLDKPAPQDMSPYSRLLEAGYTPKWYAVATTAPPDCEDSDEGPEDGSDVSEDGSGVSEDRSDVSGDRSDVSDRSGEKPPKQNRSEDGAKGVAGE